MGVWDDVFNFWTQGECQLVHDLGAFALLSCAGREYLLKSPNKIVQFMEVRAIMMVGSR